MACRPGRSASAGYRRGTSILEDVQADEAELISGYLPAELGDDELRVLVGDAIAETGATSQKDMGRVMQAVVALAGGRADGKRVSGLVREALQAL